MYSECKWDFSSQGDGDKKVTYQQIDRQIDLPSF